MIDFRKWKKQRRLRRAEQRRRDPSSYPTDMRRDVVETIAAVCPFTMTSTERLHGLCEAVRYVSETGIEGDIVECGVWRGGSMMAVAKMLASCGDFQRDLFLFDTFEGMSEPTENDVDNRGNTAADQLESEDPNDPKSVWCVSSLDEVRTNMATTGYPTAKTHFIVGKVEDTIPQTLPEKISLLRLDTDWYESTRHEMEHLFPRLADGGVLIIDDYGHWEGARRAVDEYFEQHGIHMMLNRLDYTGRIGIKHVGMNSFSTESRRAVA
ncbi:TylF/MycF/NovP-related O-methyltransferase [Crateriforma spongiae]|uniref:TylF/MycF/NovP-related O-methyltransferase n=1 Tax=Crateriforma spongiae TaxID=2724528 RepID=UPI0039AF8CA4